MNVLGVSGIYCFTFAGGYAPMVARSGTTDFLVAGLVLLLVDSSCLFWVVNIDLLNKGALFFCGSKEAEAGF